MLIIGHRGAAGHAPENTLASVRKALELNVDAVEVDVHLSRDNQLIVLHDSRLDRTTDGSGDVSEHCLDQIRLLNAGNGHHVPTLGEVLDLIDGRVPVNIEIKSRSATRFVSCLIHEYFERDGWSPDRFLVSSFDFAVTAEAYQLDPHVPLGLLVEGHPGADLWREAERQQVRFVGIGLASMTRPLVEEAHRRGLQVLVYTVNTVEQAKELMQIAVDGIFTDYPDRVADSG